MTNEIKMTSLKHRIEPKFDFFVTFDFVPFKINKLYFTQYTSSCSEIITHDVTNI